MSVLIVDWLGRGGIAQTSEAWALELSGAGRDVTVLTRAGGELEAVAGETVSPASSAVLTHIRIAQAAADYVSNQRPEVVVVQNYIVPALETPLFRAAEAARSRLVIVIHDHRLHSPMAGTRLGLRRVLRRADAVVTHSHWVGRHVDAYSGRPSTVLPIPIALGLLAQPPAPIPQSLRGDGPLALHFGVLKRRYKGTDVVAQLAREGVAPWRFGIIGVGAPRSAAGASTIPGFVAPSDLVACIRSSAASLLPYRFATQSGAVALAQALGSIPIGTRVGGIPEQIEHGNTGLLVSAAANASTWASLLERLNDEGERARMAALALRARSAAHALFRDGILDLTT